jgi:intracellular septation protein
MLKKAIFNMAIECGPIVVFSILVDQTTFFVATAWFVILTAISLAGAFMERGSFALFPFVVAMSIIGFGGLTLYLQDSLFFIFKDTLYNAAFGILIFFYLSRGIPFLKPLFRDTFAMTDTGWLILSRRWEGNVSPFSCFK